MMVIDSLPETEYHKAKEYPCRYSHDPDASRSQVYSFSQNSYQETRRKQLSPTKPIWIEKRRRDLPNLTLITRKIGILKAKKTSLRTVQDKPTTELP